MSTQHTSCVDTGTLDEYIYLWYFVSTRYFSLPRSFLHRTSKGLVASAWPRPKLKLRPKGFAPYHWHGNSGACNFSKALLLTTQTDAPCPPFSASTFLFRPTASQPRRIRDLSCPVQRPGSPPISRTRARALVLRNLEKLRRSSRKKRGQQTYIGHLAERACASS